jgi:hypothetical protein
MNKRAGCLGSGISTKGWTLHVLLGREGVLLPGAWPKKLPFGTCKRKVPETPPPPRHRYRSPLKLRKHRGTCAMPPRDGRAALADTAARVCAAAPPPLLAPLPGAPPRGLLYSVKQPVGTRGLSSGIRWWSCSTAPSSNKQQEARGRGRRAH